MAWGRRTQVAGVLKTTPGQASYGIELFSNPPGTRQARRFLGSETVQAGGNGRAQFEIKAKRVPVGTEITAIAIDDGAATSEISGPVKVRAG